MSDNTGKPPPSNIPTGHILRRAVNLLQSNGQPVSPELETIHEHTPATNLRRGGIGNSIRRIFKGVVKDANLIRRRSFGRKRHNTSQDVPSTTQRSTHTRAFSDGHITRPTSSDQKPRPPPVKTHSAPSMVESKSLTGEVEVTSPISPDIHVPPRIQQGTFLTRVTRKKQKTILFHLDAEQGQISWDSKIIPIECIKEIRSGSDGRYYRQRFKLTDEYEARWITIVYILDGEYKTLHLIAQKQEEFDMWDSSLRKLHAIRQEVMSGSATLEMKQAIWEKQYWKVADQEADQKLDFDEVEMLCKRLNVNTPTDELYRLFKNADQSQRGYLDFHDFRRFVKLLKSRPEVTQLYNKLRNENNGVFDVTVFIKFMREEQQSTLSDDELEQMFTRYTQVRDGSASPGPRVLDLPLSSSPPQLSPPPMALARSSSRPSTAHSSLAPGSLSLDGFTSFLLSSDNSAFSDQHGKVWQDMTRPLPEYYISSSHNTYLVGHQLVGDSTIEGYIRALLHSCRSVEVDIYDGEEEPMIFHGKTLTSKVSLREVCEAVAKYGFTTSPYPIIISAEIHCGLAQQEMVVEIMRSVFGEALVTAPLGDTPNIESLPSPEDLRYRILLKAKNLLLVEKDKETVETDSNVDISTSSTSDSESFPDFLSKSRRRSSNADGRGSGFLSRNRSHKRSVSASAVPPAASANVVPPSPLLSPTGLVRSISRRSQNSDRPKPKMSFALVALLVYTVGVKCRGINKKESYKPEHMFSLSENTANKYLKQAVFDLIKHNKTHLVRIYPKGTRLNSTNYEPHRFWAAGAQLVAINWQTFDLGYMINHAMFQRNGRAGYVLKPEALRLSDKTLLQQRTQHRFNITVISAQQLPRPKDASGREIVHKSIVDPYVEVSLYVPEWSSPMPNSSHPMSARVYCYRTGAVKNNGFNPVWHETLSFSFECVGGMLDLVFVKFAVWWEDKDNAEPLALYCASLGSLQRGYRHLPLHDAQLSQYLFSTLFVHINVQTS